MAQARDQEIDLLVKAIRPFAFLPLETREELELMPLPELHELRARFEEERRRLRWRPASRVNGQTQGRTEKGEGATMKACPWCGCGKSHAVAEMLPAKVKQLLMEVSAEHDVALREIIGKSRKVGFVEARACAVKRMWWELHMPLKTIGAVLSNRDHSTIIHLRDRQPVWRCSSFEEATG